MVFSLALKYLWISMIFFSVWGWWVKDDPIICLPSFLSLVEWLSCASSWLNTYAYCWSSLSVNILNTPFILCQLYVSPSYLPMMWFTPCKLNNYPTPSIWLCLDNFFLMLTVKFLGERFLIFIKLFVFNRPLLAISLTP